MQSSRGNRRGKNFTVRISEAEMELLQSAGYGTAGPGAMGPWLLWRAIEKPAGHCQDLVPAVPRRRRPIDAAMPVRGIDTFSSGPAMPARDRIIIDLCAGSGSWSQPYVDAGYDVRRFDLPNGDITDPDVQAQLPRFPWGVLAAPPCDQFSVAKTRGKRDFATALEVVCACLKVCADLQPKWWALENPGSGMLRRWLGRPSLVFQPNHYGDPWTKLTAIWGRFEQPSRCDVPALHGMPGVNSKERAVTPPGFANAFFRANP